ncbi:MAG: FtsQ-type POTRA domain-containing protein [Bacillota bacterium]|nr:FtsQ-type POTRA domain-containing protein [Bacillota bacterium]
MQRWRPLLLLALILLVAAAYAAWQSPFFAVEEVWVEGWVQVSPEAVAQAAGVAKGTPLWRISAREVAARVWELPLVEKVEVHKEWPNRLLIRIRERRPVAVVVTPHGLYGVDAAGRILEEGLALTGDLPVITGDTAAYEVRGHVTGVGASRAVEVARELARHPEIPASEIHIVADDTLVLYLADGTPVILGTASEPDRQMQVLGGLWESLQREGKAVDYINVSDPSMPVAKPRYEVPPPPEPPDPETIRGG